MNADQGPHRMQDETATTTTAPRARQGDRRTWTFWVLVISTITAMLVGIVLLGMRENPPAENAQKNPPAESEQPPAISPPR